MQNLILHIFPYFRVIICVMMIFDYFSTYLVLLVLFNYTFIHYVRTVFFFYHFAWFFYELLMIQIVLFVHTHILGENCCRWEDTHKCNLYIKIFIVFIDIWNAMYYLFSFDLI